MADPEYTYRGMSMYQMLNCYELYMRLKQARVRAMLSPETVRVLDSLFDVKRSA